MPTQTQYGSPSPLYRPCSPYVTQSNPNYVVVAPCNATDCVAVVQTMVEDLPNCTYSGVSNKIEVQDALASCNEGDTGSLTVSSLSVATSTSTSTSSNASISTPSNATECTAEEEQSTLDLYTTAAGSPACAPYATITNNSISVNAVCEATECVSIMIQLAEDLPDCVDDGANQKTVLSAALEPCMTPAATVGASCTTSEIREMWELYSSVAASGECEGEASVDGYKVLIFTPCDSECAGKVKTMAASLPNCYYDFEFSNKKEATLEEVDACSTTPEISLAFSPDNAVDFFSPSAASSNGSDSEPLVSPDTSSSIGSAESEASPRSFNGLVQLSVVASLLLVSFPRSWE